MILEESMLFGNPLAVFWKLALSFALHQALISPAISADGQNSIQFKADFRAANDSLTAYLFLSESCPICQSSTLEIKRLQTENAGKPVKILAVFPNRTSSEETVKRFLRKYKLPVAFVNDTMQKLVKQFEATTTPEVILLNNSQEIVYRGLIDNSYVSVGKRRQVVTAHYLSDAIKAYLSKGPIAVTHTEPVGCLIQSNKIR